MKIIFFAIILIVYAPFSFAQKITVPEKNKTFVLGRIEELYSQYLKEKRVLNIYLPEGYQQNDTSQYPVIYLLDGSADEDFIHVAGLVQFYTFPWIARLPKSILVGIATVDRKRDFTFPTTTPADKKQYPSAGHSDRFITFIEKELQPFIEHKYKTNRHKTLIGQSLGGLLASEILYTKQYLFDHYIIISPSLWWSSGALLQRDFTPKDYQFLPQTKVYIAVGKEGLAPGNRVMEVDANLFADKLKELNGGNEKVFFDYLPAEDHGTISHQAISNGFKQLYPVVQERRK